jgi:hypothetical protein
VPIIALVVTNRASPRRGLGWGELKCKMEAALRAAHTGSKSGSGRWSQWDEIGWVHYPEIGWSHFDEISGVHYLTPKSMQSWAGPLKTVGYGNCQW